MSADPALMMPFHYNPGHPEKRKSDFTIGLDYFFLARAAPLIP